MKLGGPVHRGVLIQAGAIRLVLTIVCSSVSYASGPGTTGGNILNIPVGARAIAMGEAYTAQADDVSSLYWNPAGLALLNQSQASFMYNQNIQDMTYSHMSVATPLENGGLGASLSYLSFGKIDGYDTTGAPTGNVSAYSGVATVGGAWLGDNWSAGFNAKGVQGSLADVKANGFAADLGLNTIYPAEVMGGTLRFGATLRNLGTGLKFIQETDPFPTEYRVGVAAVQMLDRKLNMSMDYGKARDNKGAVYAGAEYWIGQFLALRTGYAGTDSESNGLRLGMGLKVRDFSFDYSYGQFGELGLTHRYELTYRFGAIRPLLSPEERKILRRGKQAMKQGNYGEAVMLFNSLIELEPRYRPVRQLIKTAMAQLEKQEDYAKNMNKFNFSGGRNAASPDNNPGELAELEQLLNMSESANVMVPAKQAETKGKVQ
jgi:Uncharacterised protein family (UPF0164)